MNVLPKYDTMVDYQAKAVELSRMDGRRTKFHGKKGFGRKKIITTLKIACLLENGVYRYLACI